MGPGIRGHHTDRALCAMETMQEKGVQGTAKELSCLLPPESVTNDQGPDLQPGSQGDFGEYGRASPNLSSICSSDCSACAEI